MTNPQDADFYKNVFINCPYDDNYRQLLLAMVFTVLHLGLNPKLVMERSDAGTSRIDSIVNLISNSKFGIHDLSRMVSTSKDEPYRMNMPFELGVDYGSRKFGQGLLYRNYLGMRSFCSGEKYNVAQASSLQLRAGWKPAPRRKTLTNRETTRPKVVAV